MKLDDFFQMVKDKHEPENIDEPLDYSGEHENFDEGDALQRFRDCFAEDIE